MFYTDEEESLQEQYNKLLRDYERMAAEYYKDSVDYNERIIKLKDELNALKEELAKASVNKSPTPETDAVTMQPVDRLARAYTFHGTKPFEYSTKELVPAEFARELERERDKLKQQLAMCRAAGI